jgi:hypothetical protein
MADPITASLALQGVGTALSAGGTIAGGASAARAGQMRQQAANFTAAQLEENAAGAIGAGQRAALDKENEARLVGSAVTARAAASGIDAGVGTPVSLTGDIAARGRYQALLEMFQGENRASGLRNQATTTRYEGELAKQEGEAKEFASILGGLGTIAGGGASMFQNYTRMTNPLLGFGR